MLKIQIKKQQSSFVVGEKIQGDLHWDELLENTEKIDVRLIWFTRGKGDRDFEVVENQLIANPEIRGNAEFNFVAAARPYSFSGKLISLTWAIEAIVIPSLAAEQVEFVVSNSGKEIVLGGG